VVAPGRPARAGTWIGLLDVDARPHSFVGFFSLVKWRD
jgi:hypothetical protein